MIRARSRTGSSSEIGLPFKETKYIVGIEISQSRKVTIFFRNPSCVVKTNWAVLENFHLRFEEEMSVHLDSTKTSSGHIRSVGSWDATPCSQIDQLER